MTQSGETWTVVNASGKPPNWDTQDNLSHKPKAWLLLMLQYSKLGLSYHICPLTSTV